MWSPVFVYVTLKGGKLKLNFTVYIEYSENPILNALFIHMIQNMQPALAIGALLCNYSYTNLKYNNLGPSTS